MAGSSSTPSKELQTLLNFFNGLSFNQPLAKTLLSITIDAIGGQLRGDDLSQHLSNAIPPEAFVLREIMATPNFYRQYCYFLNLHDIDTPSTRTTKDMLILRVLVALFNDEQADQTFSIFRQNRKAMKQTSLDDPELYGDSPVESTETATPRGDTATRNSHPTASAIDTNRLSSLSEEQLRSLLAILLNSGTNVTTNVDMESINTDRDTKQETREQRFRLETALGKLQTYYSKAPKYSGDFEDDLEDALTEFNTASRGQLAPDEYKPELFRLALKGRALTFYKSIDATSLPWQTVQLKFRDQFMSRTKRAEISAELDGLHISTLRTDSDTDRQALDKLIARLDKLSLMGTEDDRKDEPKIRRLHNAIAHEEWTYFAMCKLPVVYNYEEMVSILRKSITDLSQFERQRKKPHSKPVSPGSEKADSKTKLNPWSDSQSSSKPPPLDALYNSRSPPFESRKSCFNCEKEGCMLGRCKEPLNLKRIAQNLERFKKQKADRSNNSRWRAKRINLSDLQPTQTEWLDVYETVVAESLLDQHGNNTEAQPDTTTVNSASAFTQIVNDNDDDKLVRAFQTSVGTNDDPDIAESTFTSLFDLMRTPPSINTKHDEHF